MSSEAFARALRLLTRREHGAYELCVKLKQKGHEAEEASLAVAQCQELGLQNDFRFSESRCRLRIGQGYGPTHIAHELKQLRVDEAIIHQVLDQESENWQAHATRVWLKKFGNAATSFTETQKQKRFLLYKGFGTHTINEVVNAVSSSKNVQGLPALNLLED